MGTPNVSVPDVDGVPPVAFAPGFEQGLELLTADKVSLPTNVTVRPIKLPNFSHTSRTRRISGPVTLIGTAGLAARSRAWIDIATASPCQITLK